MDKLRRKISPVIYKPLIDANLRSLPAILNRSPDELTKITKLPPGSVKILISEASRIVNEAYITVDQVKDFKRISTGCPSIDKITRSGIPVNGINEICGCSGVGKTQLCLQLSLMVQLPQQLGGRERGVVYICTDHVFPSKRLHQLAQVFKNKYANISFEDNIFIEHVADFVQLKACIFSLLPKLLNARNIGLLVIDSIAGVFRSDNLDTNYVDRSQQLVGLATELNRISTKYGLAVLCINQVTDNVDAGLTEPCLGLAWSNLVTSRFDIVREADSQWRTFQIVFAADLEAQLCKFRITTDGLL